MMKINKSKALILVSVLVVAMISGGTLLSVFASNDERKNFSQGPRRPWLGELADAQKEEIKQTIEDMKEVGATHEEIKEAVDAKLDAWGIEVPENPPMFRGPRRPWLGELADAQKEEIKQTIEDMKEVGATHEEIKEAVDAKLDAWGIEVPENPRGGYLMDQLTEEQREELSEKMQELRESGASCEEMMEAKLKLLEEFGIDIDEIPQPPMMRHRIQK